ncbi:MAG TPA: P1 family peptidase [Gemmatimonadaceae bacterium]|nr:P1 family peptidase [Gemmatimonadaceae bacterium]
MGEIILLAAVIAPCAAAAQNRGQPGQPPRVQITQVAPGPSNTITDVPGIWVGQYSRFGDGYRSGTTVIRTDSAREKAGPGMTAGYSQMGGAPGTKETDLLKPGGNVRTVQAIVLSGGSAYGLDANTGVMRWMEEHDFGFRVGAGVVPIVPGAILLDLGRGGEFKKRPDAEFGYKAADAATTAPVQMGRIGAGLGAGWGLGSASVKLSNGYTVGAIVALNPGGSPVDLKTCLPYGMYLEMGNEFNLVQPTAAECAAGARGRGGRAGGGPGDGSDNAFSNTTIAVVATDAPLEDLEAERMAVIANTGLARTIRPIWGIGDGDTVFGLATTPPSHTMTNAELGAIFNAAADALGRAVIEAVIVSKQVGNSRVGYCDEYPSACKLRKAAGK